MQHLHLMEQTQGTIAHLTCWGTIRREPHPRQHPWASHSTPVLDNGIHTTKHIVWMEAFLYTMNHNKLEINKGPVCEWILFYKEMNCPHPPCPSSILTKSKPSVFPSQIEQQNLCPDPFDKYKAKFLIPRRHWQLAQRTSGWAKPKPGMYRAIPGTRRKWW